MADTPAAAFYKNATQGLTNAWQAVTLEVQDFMEGGVTQPTTSTIRVPVDGVYEVSYFLAFTTLSSSDWELLGRCINATTGKQIHQSNANAGQNTAVPLQGVSHKFYAKLAANDDLTLQSRTEPSATFSGLTGTSDAYTSLSIRFIGESIDRIEAYAPSLVGDATATAAGTRRYQVSESLTGQATVTADGRVRVRGTASVSGQATTSSDSTVTLRGQASVSGDATVSASGRLRHRVSEALSGQAMVSANATMRRQASASVQGEATVSAFAQLTLYTLASDSWTITSTATSDLGVPGVLPGQTRTFYSSVEDLVPMESSSCGMSGNPSVSNKLTVTSSSSLAIVGGYAGLSYTFAGPADISSVPKQLGFKKGDKLKLKGPAGTESNHGREVTFEDPASISVMEVLVTPDATEYEFTALRRNL